MTPLPLHPGTTEHSTGEAGRSLSDYWRIDRSSDRSRELASILGGAATQAGFVRARLGRTRTPGESVAPLVLDPRLLSGFSAPVPGTVVDCIVGLAVRDAAFRELSAPASALADWQGFNDAERREFTRVYRALEEVYVAVRLSRLSAALAGYLRTAHRMLAPWSCDAAPWDAVPLTREAILEAWLGARLCGRLRRGKPECAPLNAARELDSQARAYLREREPNGRLARAVVIWRWLAAFPGGISGAGEPWWIALEGGSAGSAEERDNRRQMRKNVLGGSEAGGFVDLSEYVVDSPSRTTPDEGDVPVELKGGTLLLTEELRDLGVRAAATAIKDASFDPAGYERVRTEMEGDIETVRRLFARMDDARSRWRHGLRRGKLDGRGLTRIAAGKASVFKRRDRRGGSTSMVFLIDVSASMKSHMPAVHRAACVVAEALRGLAPRVWYEVLTYTSGGLYPGAPVQLTRLAASGMPLSLKDVWCDGGTPTGEAIAAALLVLRRRTSQRKLVLHFTDGHPKDTYVVRQSLELCRRAGVDVLTISVGAPQDGLYGTGKCEVAYAVSELPDVLARLLPRLYR